MLPMRFGIVLTGGSRPALSREQELTELLLKARTAREAGFHSLWVGPGYLQHGWHAAVLLARVAAEAPGLELGLVGILPLYHPVELAEQLATLDVICGGKLTLAAAIGWRDFQFRAFEVPQGQRLSRFQEVLEVMHKLWSQPRLTYRGKHFQLDDIPGASVPLQRPYPKLLIAANLDPGIRRAARIADGWLVSSRATFTTIQRQMAIYRDALQQTGKTGYVAAWREMFVAQSQDAALATIRPSVEWLYRDRAALGHNRLLPEADRIDVPFEQVLEGRFILGSPAECIAEVARYRAVGVEELIMRCQWPGMAVEPALQAIQRFGSDVLPRCMA
jgi:alkanesulfonate monooxygenase SsuD/methylene tetrahydromethanopterin reductase-like flavin-dependent oxidoreductase (luciferase family)